MDERGRQSILISAGLRPRGRGESCRAVLRDVSTFGAKVRSETILTPKTSVEIALPNIGTVEAKVMWVKSSLMGIKFEVRVDPKALRQAVSGEYKRAETSSEMPEKRIL